MANQYTTRWPDRFWSKVDKTHGCWNWTGYRDDSGYGVVRFGGSARRSHRVSYEIHFGEFDKELKVLHRCDNPSCVNPDHLFLGTHAANMVDMVEKKRHGAGSSAITEREFYLLRPDMRTSDTCKNGHVFSGSNLRIKRINNRFARVCRSCERAAANRDRLESRVKSMVRNVENRGEVVAGIVKKIRDSGEACFYCGGEFEYLVRHVPKSHGGVISVDNVNPACHDCWCERMRIAKQV